MAEDMKPILEVEHLTKTYGKGDTAVTAVNNISFSVEKGEFVAIVGASGSGKSTLLHLVGGVDKADDGGILVDGDDVLSLKDEQRAIFRRRKIGFVFQEYNLVPVLSVEENIKMPVLLDGRKPDEEYLEGLLEMLGLQDRRDFLPNQLSGGQKQRVAIGRALANRPSIILADEPTGNLDKQNSREIIALLKRSVEEYAMTLLLITHDEILAGMADRIIQLEDGKIISDVRVKHSLSEEAVIADE